MKGQSLVQYALLCVLMTTITLAGILALGQSVWAHMPGHSGSGLVSGEAQAGIPSVDHGNTMAGFSRGP